MSFLLSLLAAAGIRTGKAPIETEGLIEASAGFDSEMVKPFLLRLAGRIDTGFTPKQARVLARRINSLWLDQTGNWAYDVCMSGHSGRLVIGGFKDDFSAPDIFLYSSPAIAPLIERELSEFLEASGI